MDNNNINPGGSPDVIVAVIDTGVDYNHLDLRNNIWINTAEIPGNGIDDDRNGYIDDVRGWDCVGNDNDPMDDNGHGTHVAGIIAAENNTVGAVGIAFNCKVMVLKAGNSSGYFNNSDIAEAIQYAYMNGASVINMSLGGASMSIAVEDALRDAYNTCVLVAAAGNSGLCNQPGCPEHQNATPFYPAALPFVIGVMSCNAKGNSMSVFTNYDHYPYNSYEYEVIAAGESIYSTWPGNKYAELSGTSMAAPTVAGIAALLRSYYSDREAYSAKFIQSQIVNTGDELFYGHTVADVHAAMTEIPTPAVGLYDYWIDDSTSISATNNDNGVIDAGETIHLYVSFHNRGGIATDVNVSIDTIRHDDPSLTDPYFTFNNAHITLSDIGTYSVRESGDQYFEIVVSPNCPNSYLSNFNVRFTYKNGMDASDSTVYEDEGAILCNVNRGYHLPGLISKDTVFEADRLYIVSSEVMIPEGVTVTFKEGCQIQFYDNREYFDSPSIIVYGTLNFDGTADNMIQLAPDELHQNFVCTIKNFGVINISYMNAINLVTSKDGPTSVAANTYIEDSHFRYELGQLGQMKCYIEGKLRDYSGYFSVGIMERCVLDSSNAPANLVLYDVRDSYVALNANNTRLHIISGATNNMFYITSKDLRVSSTSNRIVFGDYQSCANVRNNYFFTSDSTNASLIRLTVSDNSGASVIYENNAFSEAYQKFASQVIEGYYDASGNITVDVYGTLGNPSALWPHVVSVEMFDKDGNPITKVGKEEIKVRVTFNRPMDTTKETYLTFGTIEPYADYKITGSYVSNTVWEGTYTLKAQIENGQNFLKVNNACAAENQTKTVFGEYQLHEFTIDTTVAMSMNLQAVATDAGIDLTWFQDEYDTLLGYNIYRSEEKDGNFVKLNPSILLPTDESFLDENAEPGKTYWYTYTVVLTDFTESNPAGKVVATAMDTVNPNIYHTPVNQGYANNNLVISCTASDNVAISNVTLYYRTVGESTWKSLNMSKQNDKYSATIFGSDVTLAGIEYYIVASDGINTISKGSAETPYTVVVKDASTISRLGDVDGDGTVTTKDALMIMQTINGDLILSDDAFQRADLNKNGTLDSMEALRILQYINGNVNSLEM